MILYLEVECTFYEGHSLKEKRSTLKRIIHKLRNRFNISIAEIDYHDLWQRTKLGIVTISNEHVYAEKIIQEVLGVIDSFTEIERTLTDIQQL